MRKILAILLAFTIFSLSACAFNTDEPVVSYTSPDGLYTLSLYQIGVPGWPFGSVNAKLVLTRSNHRGGYSIAELRFSLANDGCNVYEGNIAQVLWQDDCVEVVMRESDTSEQYRYILAYK